MTQQQLFFSHLPPLPPFADSIEMKDCFSVILDGYGCLTIQGPL